MNTRPISACKAPVVLWPVGVVSTAIMTLCRVARGQVCAAASGGETQPDYFLTQMDEECRVEYGLASRCGKGLGSGFVSRAC